MQGYCGALSSVFTPFPEQWGARTYAAEGNVVNLGAFGLALDGRAGRGNSGQGGNDEGGEVHFGCGVWEWCFGRCSKNLGELKPSWDCSCLRSDERPKMGAAEGYLCISFQFITQHLESTPTE
jgi:hypothetical protein